MYETFPGTGIVELGRGEDYAWSATSAGSDNIDTVAEKLCNADGTNNRRLTTFVGQDHSPT